MREREREGGREWREGGREGEGERDEVVYVSVGVPSGLTGLATKCMAGTNT